MKTLLFVENLNDCSAAKKFLSSNSAGQSTVLINLNLSLVLDPAEFSGAEFKKESDYLKGASLGHLNYQAVKDTRGWLNHPIFQDAFKFSDIDMNVIFEHNWVRAVTTIYKYVELIRDIIEVEKPSQIVLFSDSEAGDFNSDLRIVDGEKLADKLTGLVIEKYFSNKNITVSILPYETSGSKQAGSLKKSTESSIRGVLGLFRKIANAFCDHRKNGVLVVGASRIMFPIISELKREGKLSVSFYQRTTSPKLMLWLLKNKVKYLAIEDAGSIEKTASDTTKIDELIRKSESADIFRYQGIYFLPVFNKKLRLLFESLIPNVLSDLEKSRSILKQSGCRSIIIDEDVSYASRTLLLTARSMGIQSAEFQHGTVTKYFTLLKVTDKKIVWGNYFKNKVREEMEVSPEDIFVSGPVHLKHLADGKNTEKEKSVREQFQISADKKIVLFTPHAFHKGSKGGLLNLHQTREGAETMFLEVLTALQGRKDVHLIVKLHHADKNEHFYHEFASKHAPGLKFSLIMNSPSIHILLSATSILISPVSTAVLEALLMNVPVVHMNLGKQEHIFPYCEWKSMDCADARGNLKQILDAALVNLNEYSEMCEEGRQNILKEFAAVSKEGFAAEGALADFLAQKVIQYV